MAASVAETAAVNPKGTKMLLVNGVSTFFMNGKPTDINRSRKLRNTPSWLVTFPLVPFNNIPLFSKDITAFTSFISLLFLNPLAMPF